MRTRTIPIVFMGSLAVAACGSTGGRVASALRPPTPVNLSVYVNDSKVSVSPGSAGAGPVVFIVTNQASHAEALAISRSGGNTLASTAPINPQGTTQVTVDLSPGDYTVGIGAHGANDAALSQQSSIQPASVHIGHHRPSSSNQLMQP